MGKRLDVIFALKSPLHIGYLPFKGSVISPTRYYIPGKNFWGAITKRATEHLYNELSSKDYRKIGLEIKNNFRFSYFYLYDGNTIFIPKYTDSGLVFGEDGKEHIDKFSFERRFIGSRVLTEINSKFGTAKDEKLHEIEFIKHKFRDKDGNIKETKIIGCIWIKDGANLKDSKIRIKSNGIFINGFNLIDELTLGGEQCYGFGKVHLEKRFLIEESNNTQSNEIKIKIESDSPILSHLKYEQNVPFHGEVELLIGRGYFDIEKSDSEDKNMSKENQGEDPNKREDDRYKKDPGKVITNKGFSYFSPGTILKKETKGFVCWDGTIQHYKKNGGQK